MAESPLVLSERHEAGVEVLILNRPDKHNAMSNALMAQLADHIERVRDDADARVLVLTGAGPKAFCAGKDMSEGFDADAANANGFNRSFEGLTGLQIPTIAAVNGYAFGGGAMLALMCDLRYAARTATFRFPGAAYGLSAGAGLLASVIGPARAKDLIFTTRVVAADEALALGLVNGIADDDVKSKVLEIATSIAAHSPAALAVSKQMIDAHNPPVELARNDGQANRPLRTEDQARRFQAAADRVVNRR